MTVSPTPIPADADDRTPDLSIVIVSYNTKDLLQKCLTSLQKYLPDAEVIVVDNASKDGSAQHVREHFPNVRLLELPTNQGFAGGNNPGIALAQGRYILLLNSDTQCLDAGLEELWKFMDAHPRVGAASPRLIGPDGNDQQAVHFFPSLKGMIQHALPGLEKEKSTLQNVDPQQDSTTWLAGTALCLRAEALGQVGHGLDHHFFMYWEDADLSAKLRAQGWNLAYVENVAIQHWGGASGGGQDEHRRLDLYAWYMWGRHRWMARHRGPLSAIALWYLDAFDVLRKFLRGLRHAHRRSQCAQAYVLAKVLLYRLFAMSPPRPGKSNS